MFAENGEIGFEFLLNYFSHFWLTMQLDNRLFALGNFLITCNRRAHFRGVESSRKNPRPLAEEGCL
jgi:hypothetical protein